MIDELQKLDYKTNIIICSSVRYAVKEIAGNIFYNKARDLNFDFRDVINRLDWKMDSDGVINWYINTVTFSIKYTIKMNRTRK